MDEPKTIDETLAILRAQPGIDISRLAPGTTVIVETTQGIIELVVLNPTVGLVRVSGTDPKIKEPVNCQMTQSCYDLKGLITLPKWIGKDLRMQLTFRNANLHCSTTVSATVRGKGWHYDVFR
jgi:phenolic acid decarboxylase